MQAVWCLSIVPMFSRYEYSNGRKISNEWLRVWRVYLLFRNRKKVIKSRWNRRCRNLNLLEYTFRETTNRLSIDEFIDWIIESKPRPRQFSREEFGKIIAKSLLARFRGKNKENSDGADYRIRSIERNVTSLAWIHVYGLNFNDYPTLRELYRQS